MKQLPNSCSNLLPLAPQTRKSSRHLYNLVVCSCIDRLLGGDCLIITRVCYFGRNSSQKHLHGVRLYALAGRWTFGSHQVYIRAEYTITSFHLRAREGTLVLATFYFRQTTFYLFIFCHRRKQQQDR
jgi:hypothetical protein